MQANIALIGKNSLMMQGLKSMLESIASFANITIYATTAEMLADHNIGNHFHYFITPPAYLEDPEFYTVHKNQTIILSDGQSEQGIPTNMHRINMLLPAEELLKQFLLFQQYAHKGYNRYPHAIADKLQEDDSKRPVALSSREIDVLKLLACGFINKEVADQLHISINTVITHRKNIMQKLGSQSLSRLVIYAVQHGHIRAEDIK